MRRLLALGYCLILAGILCLAQQERVSAFWQSRDSNYNVAISGGGGGFTPASLAALKTWVKGDAKTYSDVGCSTPSTTGNQILCWGDNSGLGNNLITAMSPVANWVSNSLNSLPTVNPFGSGASQGFQAAIALSPATALSCFGLFENTAATANNDRFISIQGNGQSNDFGNASSALVYWPSGTSLSLYQNSAPIASTTVALSTWYQFGVIFSGSTATFYVGGSSVGAASNSTTFTSPPTIAIGSAVGMGSALTGKMAEFFCGNADWTSNLSQIHTYLLGKWGVS